MANFSALKTAIQNAIKQNGNEEITGDVLQQILLSIVSTMGDGAINTIEQNLSSETLARQNADSTLQSHINAEALTRGNADTQLQNAINAIKANIDNGYVYAGIATPSSTPVSGKVFYIATAAGTYTNFGGQVLTQGINILRYNGSAWSNQQLIGIDDVPTSGSGNLVKSSGVQNELALGAVYDVSAKNPTAGPNNDGKWESLSALLSDANLNTLIPAAYRKGGMSIKFVHTNDNKYVQARCMADEFTTDTTQWAIAEEGVYVENPEFVYVKTDANDKILWAIKTDGTIYFGAGVPQQVIDYINEKIAELSLDEYEDIVAFLDDLEKGDKTLQTLLDEKVDKEDGKSLIDEEYADGVHYIENPEFAEVKLDTDDRILEATMLDGTKLLPAGYEVGGNVVKTISNPEYLAAWLDSSDHILFALKADGDVLFGCGVPSQINEHVNEFIKSFEELFHYEDNPEFIDVELDAEDKVLEGIKVDGTKVVGGDIEILGNMEVSGVSYKVVESPEYLAAWVDAEDKIIFGFKADGKTYVGDADFLNDIDDIKAFLSNGIGKNIDWDALSSITAVENPEFIEAKTDSEGKLLAGRTPDGAAFENVSFATPKVSIDGHTIENIKDPEGRSEITTDSEGKIISYRDTDGVKHENVGIESESIKTNSLNLTPDGMTEFQQALKNAGFQPDGHGDFSDSTFVELPIPTICAYVNIIPNSDVPITNVPIDGYLEYYDHLGNYFKKRISDLDIQGDSSKAMPYKNYKFDFDDGSKIKFGNWVPQDSFHLKKYYMDNFRGQCIVGYWLAEQMYQCREFENRKPYEYLYKNTSFMNSNGSMKEDFYTGALCHPDGFPIKLYYNGTLLGVYTFNLKKDKDNYAMKKTTTFQIILDGGLFISTIWGGTIHWSAFEIRNPKPKKKKDGWSLVDINGDDYDGDNPVELMGTTTPGYDSTNQSHKKSADVKAIIERLSGAINDINSATTTEQKKEKFETYFKVDECIDYFLFANMVYDNDGLGKNWIWCTWDGLIWSPTYYDKDSIFGLIPATGLGITENSTTTILESNNTSDPIGLVYNLYRDEVIARYNELKENNVFTKENIIGLLETWVNRIGYDNLKEELEESCPETPSYRSNNLYDGWLITGLENKNLPAFDSNHTYTEGERCWFLNMSLLAMKTIEPHNSPIENPYSLNPYGGGFYNSIQRVYNWLSARFITLNNIFQ